MGEDDWLNLGVGFAVMVGPFLAFTLGTSVPLPDRRVVEWFTAFGRLHSSGVDLVRDRLTSVRWHRRIGALLGAVVAWSVACWYVLVERDGGPSWLWLLPLSGYVAGAVLAELRALRPTGTPTRVAELTPRQVSDFVAPWVVPTVVTGSVVATLASLGVSLWNRARVMEGGLVPAACLAALGIALWCARRVAHAPLRVGSGRDPYLDDAFRQVAIMTCLGAAGLAAAVTMGDAVGDLLPVEGWWQFGALAVTCSLGLPCWVALRQPVPWAFGPRIRAAWATGGAPDTAPTASPTVP
jgi:hypothetical protein